MTAEAVNSEEFEMLQKAVTETADAAAAAHGKRCSSLRRLL